MNESEELEQLVSATSLTSFIDLVNGIFKAKNTVRDDAQI
jgi:type II secretory pathway component PulL